MNMSTLNFPFFLDGDIALISDIVILLSEEK